MKKIKILIVDDEILIAEDLKDILLSLEFENIELAHDKLEAIAKLKLLNPDLVLLDIRMERELDGLEIAEYINSNNKIPFIYITAHSDVEMIKKIVKTKPSGYITKPVKKSDLYASIYVVCEKQNKSKIILKDGYKNIIINMDDINYIESEGNYINVFGDSKKIVSRQSIDGFLKELDETMFLRIHRSYIVNIKKVSKFSKKELIIGTTTLPISRNYIDIFEARIKKTN